VTRRHVSICCPPTPTDGCHPAKRIHLTTRCTLRCLICLSCRECASHTPAAGCIPNTVAYYGADATSIQAMLLASSTQTRLDGQHDDDNNSLASHLAACPRLPPPHPPVPAAAQHACSAWPAAGAPSRLWPARTRQRKHTAPQHVTAISRESLASSWCTLSPVACSTRELIVAGQCARWSSAAGQQNDNACSAWPAPCTTLFTSTASCQWPAALESCRTACLVEQHSSAAEGSTASRT
jgi:hypothetical protein